MKNWVRKSPNLLRNPRTRIEWEMPQLNSGCHNPTAMTKGVGATSSAPCALLGMPDLAAPARSTGSRGVTDERSARYIPRLEVPTRKAATLIPSMKSGRVIMLWSSLFFRRRWRCWRRFAYARRFGCYLFFDRRISRLPAHGAFLLEYYFLALMYLAERRAQTRNVLGPQFGA